MDGKQLVALANIRLKKLPFTGTGIAFISHGPMAVKTRQIFSPRDYQHILQALADHYTDQHKLCLRIEPYLYADAVMDHVPLAMQRAGFAAQKMLVQTFMIDLAPTLETLRQNLNSKWRTDLSPGSAEMCRSPARKAQKTFAALHRCWMIWRIKKDLPRRKIPAFLSPSRRHLGALTKLSSTSRGMET